MVDRSIVTLGLGQRLDSGVRLRRDPPVPHRGATETGWVLRVHVGLLPGDHRRPGRRQLWTEIEYLLLPALAIVLVYFGYIARITRAGTITALDADYTRTAYMKGLGTTQVVAPARAAQQPSSPPLRSPVPRSATCSAASSALEMVFNYPGLGRSDLPMQRRLPDFPLAAGRRDHRRGHLHDLHTLRRPAHRLDESPGPTRNWEHHEHHRLDPRRRHAEPNSRCRTGSGGATRSSTMPMPYPTIRRDRAQADPSGRSTVCSSRRPASSIGMVILVFWIALRHRARDLHHRKPNEVVRLADGATIPRAEPSA